MDDGQARAGLDGVEQVAPGPVEQEVARLPGGPLRPPGEMARADEPGRDLVGVDPQGLCDRLLAGLGGAQGEERLAPSGVPLGEVGIGLDRGVELGECEGRGPAGAKRDAEPGPGLGEIRRHLESVLERHLGPLPISGREVGVAAPHLLDRPRVRRRRDAGEGPAGDDEAGEEDRQPGRAGHAAAGSERRAAVGARMEGPCSAVEGRRTDRGVAHGRAIDTTCVVT